MRILSVEQLQEFITLIGEENVEGCTKALADNVKVWVFRTEAEVKEEQELTKEEKQFCFARFANGETWAGIFRQGVTPGGTDFNTHDTRLNSRFHSTYGGIH